MLVEVRSVAVHVDYNEEVDQQPYGSNAEGREGLKLDFHVEHNVYKNFRATWLKNLLKQT